jgi:hypothetical protein
VGTSIRRDHVVNRVNGNPHPFAVHFDFVVVLNYSTLGRATIHQVAARTFAVISLELRVEPPMPVIVAHSVMAVLCLRAYTKNYEERAAAESRDERTPSHDHLSKEWARLPQANIERHPVYDAHYVRRSLCHLRQVARFAPANDAPNNRPRYDERVGPRRLRASVLGQLLARFRGTKGA